MSASISTDGLQFSAVDEYRYHEALIHPGGFAGSLAGTGACF